MTRVVFRRLSFAAFGILILLLASSPGVVYAQPPPDVGHGFYGTVLVNGEDAPEGAVISGRVNGIEYGSCEVVTVGHYTGLIVQNDIDEGATIDFYVDDQKADQTFPFHDGRTTELDLTATAPPGDEPPSPFPLLPFLPDDCFIATAAYGTPTAEEIDVLREFRDVVLLESSAGSQFVALYYWLSPPVADVIGGNGFLMTIVRELLVDPAVWMVRATGEMWRN